MADFVPAAGASVEELLAQVKFGADGLAPAIIQSAPDDPAASVPGEVLMLAWMNEEALRRTLTTGRVTFWSRSRQEFWRKGDTSGHRQYVRGVAFDCDADTILVQVWQLGAACHSGERTCFVGREVSAVLGDPAHDNPAQGGFAR